MQFYYELHKRNLNLYERAGQESTIHGELKRALSPMLQVTYKGNLEGSLLEAINTLRIIMSSK